MIKYIKSVPRADWAIFYTAPLLINSLSLSLSLTSGLNGGNGVTSTDYLVRRERASTQTQTQTQTQTERERERERDQGQGQMCPTRSAHLTRRARTYTHTQREREREREREMGDTQTYGRLTVMAPLLVHSARVFATSLVPLANFSISNTPMGPGAYVNVSKET